MVSTVTLDSSLFILTPDKAVSTGKKKRQNPNSKQKTAVSKHPQKPKPKYHVKSDLKSLLVVSNKRHRSKRVTDPKGKPALTQEHKSNDKKPSWKHRASLVSILNGPERFKSESRKHHSKHQYNQFKIEGPQDALEGASTGAVPAEGGVSQKKLDFRSRAEENR